jgi:tRNA splicing endonuclease
MRLKYSPDVDILVIELSDKAPVESEYLEDKGIIVDTTRTTKLSVLKFFDWSKRKTLELPFVGKLLPVSA